MRNAVFLVYLVSLSVSVNSDLGRQGSDGDQKGLGDSGDDNNGSKNNDGGNKLIDKVVSYEDEERHYYNPCEPTEENCIRYFLSSYGQCSPIYKYNHRETVHRDEAVYYFPRFNFTVLLTDMTIKGLHGIVDKFYINRASGNLIYSVDFKAIDLYSKISYFEFHRQGKEPVRAADYIKVTYAPTVITAIIPIVYNELSLKHSRINAYISGNPDYEVGPAVAKNPDPVIQKTVASYTVDVPTAVQELFLTEAANLFIAYLQNYICDYGIRI